jgi:dihydroceramidase
MALVEYLVTMDESTTGKTEVGFVWPVEDALREVDAVERREVRKDQ